MKRVLNSLFRGSRTNATSIKQKCHTSRLGVEALEAREVPAQINFSFAPSDLNGWGLSAANQASLLANLQTAAEGWSLLLSAQYSSPVTLEVQVAHSAGGNVNYASAAPTVLVTNPTTGILFPGTLYEGLTGIDPNSSSSDITINLNSDWLLQTAA